jgi:hypothetical protein
VAFLASESGVFRKAVQSTGIRHPPATDRTVPAQQSNNSGRSAAWEIVEAATGPTITLTVVWMPAVVARAQWGPNRLRPDLRPSGGAGRAVVTLFRQISRRRARRATPGFARADLAWIPSHPV